MEKKSVVKKFNKNGKNHKLMAKKHKNKNRQQMLF